MAAGPRGSGAFLPRSDRLGTFAKRICPDVVSHHRRPCDRIKCTWLVLGLALATWVGCSVQSPKHAATGEPDVASEPTVLTDAQKRRDAARAPRIGALLGASKNYGAVLSPD